MKDAQEIRSDLGQFTGTLTYHRFSPMFSTVVLTDGAKYLADAAEAYWLMDIIGSLKYQAQCRYSEFWVVKLVMNPPPAEPEEAAPAARVVVEDGDDNVLYTQDIHLTSFPLPEGITLWAVQSDDLRVILLPDEY